MKKIFILLSALCIVFCSCTADKNSDTTTQEPDTSTAGDESTASTEPDITQLQEASWQGLSNIKVVWGPGKTIDHQQPADPVKLQEKYGKYDAKFLMGNEKKVYLTFDEGYENGFTPKILDTLKAKKVSAVFFVTYDFARDNPDLIDRMIADGHVIGNHTYRHYTMDEVSAEVAEEEIMFLHNYILEKHNYEMKYFRFPKGEFSEKVLAQTQSLGYSTLFWSFAYADWDTQKVVDPTSAFEKITSSTHNGAIFLLHAVSATNADILGDVIDDVRSQGYEFGKY